MTGACIPGCRNSNTNNSNAAWAVFKHDGVVNMRPPLSCILSHTILACVFWLSCHGPPSTAPRRVGTLLSLSALSLMLVPSRDAVCTSEVI